MNVCGSSAVCLFSLDSQVSRTVVGRSYLDIPLSEYVSVLVAAVAAVAGFITWSLTERSKRLFEDYKRREERYAALVRALRGFHVATNDRELKQVFLTELELCWLYGSDDVIRAAYMFLGTVRTGVVSTDEVKEAAVGRLVLAIREDLLRRKPLNTTALKSDEFQILGAN